MLILVSYANEKYKVLDTEDNIIESYSGIDLLRYSTKLEIKGVSSTDGSFTIYPYEYHLMNKDTLVCRFFINSDKRYYILDDVYHSILPYTLSDDIFSWLDNRFLINLRYDIKTFFESLGIEDVIDFIEVTHLVSLNDTFWVKSKQDDISWNKVSPYRNSFNDTIANYSFKGELGGKNLKDSSPDLSLGGSFQKCWRRKDNKIYLIKSGSTGAMNAGYEPYSEILSYQLGKYLGLYDILEYSLITYSNQLCTSCKLFTSEEWGIIDAKDLTGQKTTDYSFLMQYLSENNIKKLKQMLCLDILTLNGDRHFGNISFYINNTTQEVGDITLIYDNNLALLPYYVMSDNNLEEYISSLRAKNGMTFESLYLSIKDKDTNSLMKKALSFEFDDSICDKKMTKARLSMLTKIVQEQARKCLDL